MRCTSPMTVGFLSDGKTLTWSPKKYSKEFPPFQLPCGKCLSCRLEYARQTAVRCVHEASMHPTNCFLTLTYSDEYLGENRLDYADVQKFIKDLRNHRFSQLLDKFFPGLPQKEQRALWGSFSKEKRKDLYEEIRISTFVSGEYGARSKRKHWHLLVFNWKPEDGVLHRRTERGDDAYVSALVSSIWGKGFAEFGAVTFESAGYCARYATKKLVHGLDGEHGYDPISRRSCKNAIGKKWIEKYWKSVFDNGSVCIIKDGRMVECGIPRYYERWLQKYRPDDWVKYISGRKQKIIEDAERREALSSEQEKIESLRRGALRGLRKTRNQTRARDLELKIKRLQSGQKF